jgi:DNA polymerase III subunit epsilon
MSFVAIDVETANADMSSICQIGLVKYSDRLPVEEWATYVNPEDEFSEINVSIHGIDEDMVKGAPSFPAVYETLRLSLNDSIAVCHTHFDRIAINQACQRYSLATPQTRWLDSARVARRTWEECSFKGYGLYDVCKLLGHDFRHHDALEDAKAAAHILCSAIEKTGMDLEAWLTRVQQPIDPSASSSGAALRREGNPEGELCGEVIVFTGALEIPRREAADLAASIGCTVAPGVTMDTTMLVVGNQDIRNLAGNEKSSKHRKAEQLIAKGKSIRILKESDFKELVRVSSSL